MARAARRRLFVRVAALVLIGGQAAAAAADVLVLRSSGPSARRHPAGQRLPDNASFALRPGDTVIVLARGGTRTFRGPGTFSALGPSLARAGAPSGVRRSTGAVRRPGDSPPAPRPTNLWHWDIARGGRVCFAVGTRPTLWRPDSRAAVELTIAPPAGAPRTVRWPAGQATLSWPETLPIANGASYLLSWTGDATPRRLTPRAISPSASDQGLAASLQSNDCEDQLDVFIALRALPESAAARSMGMGR